MRGREFSSGFRIRIFSGQISGPRLGTECLNAMTARTMFVERTSIVYITFLPSVDKIPIAQICEGRNKGTYQIGCQCCCGTVHDIDLKDRVYQKDFRPSMEEVVEETLGCQGDVIWKHLLSPIKCGRHWSSYGLVASSLTGPKLPGRGVGHSSR